MQHTLIKDILVSKPDGKTVDIYGWVRTKRDSKNLCFIEVNDGSCFASIQLTFDRESTSANQNASVHGTEHGACKLIENELKKITTGASLHASGKLIPSPASGQAVEVALECIEVLGEASAETYPLQKKGHSFEFLREIAHLRPRTNAFGAVGRMRNQMAFAVHTFFQERGFNYVHTPIITASDAEGAGEMFQVTTLDLKKIAENGIIAGAKGMKAEKAQNSWITPKIFSAKVQT